METSSPACPKFRNCEVSQLCSIWGNHRPQCHINGWNPLNPLSTWNVFISTSAAHHMAECSISHTMSAWTCKVFISPIKHNLHLKDVMPSFSWSRVYKEPHRLVPGCGRVLSTSGLAIEGSIAFLCCKSQDPPWRNVVKPRSTCCTTSTVPSIILDNLGYLFKISTWKSCWLSIFTNVYQSVQIFNR